MYEIRWLYLEPIFGGGTLAQEKVRFDRLDRDFRRIATFIERDPRVTEICKYPNLKSTLQSLLEQLSRCQHSLDNFLKEKRDVFPRFLFLSDDDLLEIIGQSSKEQIIQSHLKKLFAGIHSVLLDSAGEHIVAICSQQGEVVKLENTISIKRPVEVRHLNWKCLFNTFMIALYTGMVRTTSERNANHPEGTISVLSEREPSSRPFEIPFTDPVPI